MKPSRLLVSTLAGAAACVGLVPASFAAEADLPAPSSVKASAATELVTLRWQYPEDTQVAGFRLLDLTDGRDVVGKVGPQARRATVPAAPRGSEQVLAVVVFDGHGGRARSGRTTVQVPFQVMLTSAQEGVRPRDLFGVALGDAAGGAVVHAGYSEFPALSVTGQLAMACSAYPYRDPDLCLADPDGGNKVLIAGRRGDSEAYLQWLPAWSQDGKQLAYAKGRASDSLHLKIYTLSTGKSQRVPGSRFTTEPAWTPNGRIVARSQLHDRLVIINPQTGSRRPLDHTETAFSATVSPQGELAFSQYDPNSGQRIVVIRSLDGTERQELVLGQYTTWATFSPDGEHLTVLTFTEAGTQRIILLTRNGDTWTEQSWATSKVFLTRTVFYDSTDYSR